MKRRISKIKLKSVKIAKSRSSLRRKLKLKMWRRQFLLLRTLRFVKGIASKRRRKLRLQKRAYRKIRRTAKYAKYKAVVVRNKRNKQLAVAVLSVRLFRNPRFSSLRRRVRASRRRMRTLVRRRVFGRTPRSIFKKLRHTLRVSRRLYYLCRQRRIYRRVNRKLAIYAVRQTVCSRTAQNLRKELHRVRCTSLSYAPSRKRRLHRVYKLSRTRRVKRTRKLRAALIRRVLRINRTRALRKSALKKFYTWKFIFAAFRRAKLLSRHNQKRRRRVLTRRLIKKELKMKKQELKKKQKKAVVKKKLKEWVETLQAKRWYSRWRRRGRFIRRQRRRTKRLLKRRRNKNKIRMQLRRLPWTRRLQIVRRRRRRHKSKRYILIRRRTQRSRYRLHRMHKQLGTYLRKVRALSATSALFRNRRPKKGIKPRKFNKASKQRYRRTVVRKKAKMRMWLREVTRKTKIACARDLAPQVRAVKPRRKPRQRVRRKRFLATVQAAIRTRVQGYTYQRQHLRVRKLWSSFRHRTFRHYRGKTIIKRKSVRKIKKLRRHQRYVSWGIRHTRRLIRPYGPLKFLRWRRAPRRFIVRTLRRSARLGYARVGAQFKRGSWSRRYRDRKYNKRVAVKRFARRRKRKQKRAVFVAPRTFFKRRAYRWQLKRNKKVRARTTAKLLSARWISKRRRPTHVSARAAIRAVRRPVLKSKGYMQLRRAISRRLASRRVFVYGRTYTLVPRRNRSKFRLVYQPVLRFGLRQAARVSVVYRTRTRRRRNRARRRRYRARKKRPGILYVAPSRSRRLRAFSALYAYRTNQSNFTNRYRRFLKFSSVNLGVSKVFSLELQRELLPVTQRGAYSKQYRPTFVVNKIQRRVRRFLRKAEQQRKRLMLRLDESGRVYADDQYSGHTRYRFKYTRFIVFGKKCARKARKVRRLRRKRIRAAERDVLSARLLSWKQPAFSVARKITRSEVYALNTRKRRMRVTVNPTLVYETTLKAGLSPVLDWFDDEKNEKIYSKLEIPTPQKEILVRGKSKKICT